jgi:hypothetical protein
VFAWIITLNGKDAFIIGNFQFDLLFVELAINLGQNGVENAVILADYKLLILFGVPYIHFFDCLPAITLLITK